MPECEDAVEVARVREWLRSGRVRELRARHGLSCGEMARTLAVEVSTYSRWERGQRVPRPAAARDLASLLRALSELDTI